MPSDFSGLARFRAGLPGVLDEGAQQTAEDVKSLAEQLAPVDEGDLAATVRVLPKETEGERIVAAGGASGPNKFVDYAVHVEFGTADSPAQPFMTPAAQEIDPAFRYRELLQALASRSRV